MNRKRATLDEERHILEARLSAQTATESQASQLEAIVERLWKRLHRLGFDNRIQLVHAFVERVVVHPDRGVEIHTFVPIPPGGTKPPVQRPVRELTQERVAALPASDRVILLSACRQIRALEAEIDGLEGEIARGVADVPAVQVLLTITGMGLIGAAATWAILGDPHRFTRPKQVTRYAGLDASIVQSGEQHRPGRISKTGSPLLRTLLVEAAHSLVQWDSGPLGQFYARKTREIGPRKAIVALARKLLIVAWRMLLTGEVYRAARATTVARKYRELQKKIRIQMPSTVPVPDPARGTRRLRAYAGRTEGVTNRRRTLVST